ALVFIGIEAGAWSPDRFCRGAMVPVSPQEGNRMFAMIAGRGDEFVEDVTALFLGGVRITLPQFFELLGRRFGMTHKKDS
ncbi:MAG: hypothetical protein WCF84_13640, partial [Anaerolineae bacterium]